MMPFFPVKKLSLIIFFLTVFSLGIPGYAFAGTIVSGQKYSQFFDTAGDPSDYDINVNLNRDSRPDLINWLPSEVTTPVEITDTDVSGYIWGETVGWINLDPTNAPGGGVKNTCDGELSGYAWGQQTGWVNFQATEGDAPTINTSTGEITGQVWSQNYGWIELSSPDATYPGLYTDWRPSSSCREISNPPKARNPKLIVTKHVIGGPLQASDFTMFVKLNGIRYVPSFPGNEQGTVAVQNDHLFDGHTYQVGEIPVSGYTATITGDCDANGWITVPKGFTGTLECTITNKYEDEPEEYGCDDGRHPDHWIYLQHGTCVIPPELDCTDPGQEGYELYVATGSCTPTTIRQDPPRFPNPPDTTKPFSVFLGFDIILILAFGRRRLRGIVYDSKSKDPLDPAYVLVINLDTGKEIASEITDFDGRFGFLLPKGRYKITANKTHYKFPSELLRGREIDGVYDHLYFGEEFHVEKEEEVVIINIPMDPLEKDWNQQQKNKKSFLHYLWTGQTRFGWVVNLIFALGFFVAIVVTYYYPVLWNIIMVVIYILVFIYQLTRYALPSFGTMTRNKVPLVGARVKVFNKKLEKEIAHYITTDKGSYFLLVPPKNDYYVVVEEKNAEGVYTKVFTSPVMYTRKGIINKSFDIPVQPVKKLEEKPK